MKRKFVNMHAIEYAAKCIQESEALLITAGAGMGVDSGLTFFNGSTDGFYLHYPHFKKIGMSFKEAASSQFFFKDPFKFWYFYGHRFNEYKQAEPHKGYQDVLKLGKLKNNNYFVFTSNVDNHFLRAGFDQNRIVECLGSIFHFQCFNCWEIFDAQITEVKLNPHSFEACEIPKCPKCQYNVRPNILTFGDFDWLTERTQDQVARFKQWLKDTEGVPLTILEIGAGESVATIRRLSEEVLSRDHMKKAPTCLIRINPEVSALRSDYYRDDLTVIINEDATPDFI